jgi:hypothetical protein
MLEYRGGKWVQMLALPLPERLPETLSSPLPGSVSGFVQTQTSPLDHDALPVTQPAVEPVREQLEQFPRAHHFPAEPPNLGRLLRLVLVIVLLAGLASSFFMRVPEPVYQGKRLSAWLAESKSDGPGSALPQPSLVAVRHMGTNALPFLVRMLTAKDSSLKRPLVSSKFLTPPEISHKRALAAFRSLGPDAKGAIPLLADSLSNKSAATDSAVALTFIGPEALAPLVSAFRELDKTSRFELVDSLGNNFFNYPANIPFLIECLGDKDPGVRAEAARFLGEGRGVGSFSKDTVQVVQALARALDDKDARVRAQAAVSLRYHGVDPKAGISAPAVPLQEADTASRT